MADKDLKIIADRLDRLLALVERAVPPVAVSPDFAAADAFDRFCEKPGPIVVGAAQGASCYGPAYEFALILDTELKRRKIRDKVPMTFVTAEPYIGHLGLDGVGDTKSLLESELRNRHIKWITNARVTSFEAGMAHVEEVAEDVSVKAKHDLPFGARDLFQNRFQPLFKFTAKLGACDERTQVQR